MSSQAPFFTIVIPTYNRADFILKTIDSLLQQSFSNFEIIVVDDGSTDNTAEIMQNIDNEKVRYFPKKNEERAAARNTGASQARGNYINFFDSDDLAYPNHLQTAFDIIKKYQEPEFFHLSYDIKDGEGNFMRNVNTLPEKLNEQLILGNILSCNGVFLRKDIALQYPFNTNRALSASEDYELWLRLASRFTLYHTNTITSTVINHEARSVLTVNLEKLVNRMQLLEHYLQQDTVFMQKYAGKLARFKADNYTYIALHLALTKKERLRVLKYLFKSVLKSPQVLQTRRFYASLKHLI